MRKLFEFTCRECKETFEELTEYKKLTKCPHCDGDADKIISTPSISLEGYSGSFPGAAITWEKKHNQKAAQEAKRNAEV